MYTESHCAALALVAFEKDDEGVSAKGCLFAFRVSGNGHNLSSILITRTSYRKSIFGTKKCFTNPTSKKIHYLVGMLILACW